MPGQGDWYTHHDLSPDCYPDEVYDAWASQYDDPADAQSLISPSERARRGDGRG